MEVLSSEDLGGVPNAGADVLGGEIGVVVAYGSEDIALAKPDTAA